MQEFGQAMKPDRSGATIASSGWCAATCWYPRSPSSGSMSRSTSSPRWRGFILANLATSLIMAAALYLNFKLPAAYRTRLRCWSARWRRRWCCSCLPASAAGAWRQAVRDRLSAARLFYLLALLWLSVGRRLGAVARHGSPSGAAGVSVTARGRPGRPATGARLPSAAPQGLPRHRVGSDGRAGGRDGGPPPWLPASLAPWPSSSTPWSSASPPGSPASSSVAATNRPVKP